MRTSEAERQRVAEFLRDACADGRLNAEELEQRLDRLFTGGTVGDIERLVWDLPGGQAVVPRVAAGARVPAAVPVRRRKQSPARPLAAAVICFGVALLILLSLPPFLAVVSLAILLATGVAVAAVIAPAALVLLGLGWLISRLGRGLLGPHARGWHGGDGRPFG